MARIGVQTMKVTTMIKQTLLFTSICALLLAGALSVRAAERMAAGQWEFTMTGTGEPRILKQCITPDQANEMNGDTTTARAFAEKRAKGRCTTGDTSEGTQTTTTADGKVDTRTIKARRLGACP